MLENTKTLLLVDDEVSDREFMQRSLQSIGYTVLSAADHGQAFDIFEHNSEKIDMLIADVALPGINGCDLAKALLELKPGTQVLFVSGHVGAEVCKFYGFAVSDVHFLRKPFSADELIRRVCYLLESSHPPPLGFATA